MISDETRKRMSKSAIKRSMRDNLAEKNKTRIWTPEMRERSRNAKLGKPLSEEHRKKMSNVRKGVPKSESHRKKLAEHLTQLNKSRVGEPLLESHRQHLSGIHALEKHWNWNGGSSFEPYCVLFNNEFKERVRAFFNYQCVECKTPQNGKRLHVHHVNYNKKTCCNEEVPLFVPLCKSCHGKTNHVSKERREYWKQHFTEIINIYYSGKCYLPKHETPQIMSILAGGD